MLPPDEVAALPRGEYALPSPLRDRLVAAILTGKKTTTSSLAAEYSLTHTLLPRFGDREVVVDSAGQPVCVTENEQVEIRPLGQVTTAHALGEGEGFANVAEWRAAHVEFWQSLATEPVPLDDDIDVVCVRFRVVQRL